MFDFSRQLNFEEISAFYNVATPPVAKKNSHFFESNSYILDSGSTADYCSSPDDNSSMDLDENQNPFATNFNKAFEQGNKNGSGLFQNKDRQSKQTDRFIPNRKTSKLSVAFSPLHDSNNVSELKGVDALREDDPNFSFKCLYKNLVLGYDPISSHSSKSQIFTNTNLFRYNDENNVKNQMMLENPPLGDCEKILSAYQSSGRKIAKVPFKVLDAPALQDDFYLNLVDWSSTNILSVGLSSCVYLWSAHTSKVTKLCDLGGNDTVTSVAWAPKGTHLSVGTNSGDVQIWDVAKMKKVRVLSGHSARVGSIAWSNAVLSSGSRDKNIHNRDLRCSSNYISTLTGHKQEVCGLKWSFDEQQLASGGNDNKLHIWNLRSTSPVLRFANHTAAVKALAWSPHQHGLLASGGGTADRTIRFWNTLSSQQVDCIDTGSQVCNLVFSKNYQELVSTHGYSQNQIVLWKYPTMEKVATLTGHSYRVLYLAMSPDGENIVTGAGDETLRFWHAFPKAKKQDEAASKIIDKLKPSSFDLR